LLPAYPKRLSIADEIIGIDCFDLGFEGVEIFIPE